MRATDYLFTLQGLLFNLAFIGSMAVTQKLTRTLTEDADIRIDLDFSLGVLLIVLMMLETLALRVKFRSYSHLRNSLRAAADGTQRTGLLLLWALHVMVSIVVGLAALDALGVPLTEPRAATVLVLTLIVAKELYVLLMLLVPPDEHEPMSAAGLAFADTTLLLYAALAYFAIWQIAGAIPDARIVDYTPTGTVIQGTIAAVVFLLCFLPMRLGFVAEERLLYRTIVSRLLLWASIIAVVAVGIWPLFHAV